VCVSVRKIRVHHTQERNEEEKLNMAKITLFFDLF